MRIIGGQLKGRRFVPPDKIPARPTTDFAKEGLFNALNNVWDFREVRFLDLFAGTGNLSYEFGSRGCPSITSVEQDARLARFIRENAAEYNLPIQVMQMDVFQFLERCREQFPIIFAGPPYPLPELGEIPDKLFATQVLAPGGWFILEHNPHHNFEKHARFYRSRKYGTTIFSIFEQVEPTEQSGQTNLPDLPSPTDRKEEE
ncbi:MAG: methyltransferase [Bacteroidetes bacterium]|nr:methyltransferase [Bacteroidota bacterium]